MIEIWNTVPTSLYIILVTSYIICSIFVHVCLCLRAHVCVTTFKVILFTATIFNIN